MSRKNRITENAVLFASNGKQVFVKKVCGEGNAGYNAGDPIPDNAGKSFIKDTVFVDAEGIKYPLSDVSSPDMTTPEGCQMFVNGHNALPVQPRSGYDSFVNGYGPTNPESPRRFDPTALGRIIVCYLSNLYLQVAQGGETGETASKIIKSISLYGKSASEMAKQAVEKLKEKEFNAHAENLGLKPDELREFMESRKNKGKKGKKNTPTVEPESTVEDVEVPDESETSTTETAT